LPAWYDDFSLPPYPHQKRKRKKGNRKSTEVIDVNVYEEG